MLIILTETEHLEKRPKCSVSVKITLLKSYCMSFYDSALWRTISEGLVCN